MTVDWGFMVKMGGGKGRDRGGGDGSAWHVSFPHHNASMILEWCHDLAAILAWTGFKL